ncbi:hypothetical protein VD0001_g8532 [Verticillium dahliae]|nr:hypothetical protein VD0001_g8532 [Verticillium dahliae]
MKQDDIQPPRVTSGPGYPEAFAAQLETELSALRELIARQSSDGHLFDKRVAVDTPGLGEGHVKCSVCLPKAPGPTPGFPAPLPLIILLEGGGFALGQPSDGEANARFMSDKSPHSTTPKLPVTPFPTPSSKHTKYSNGQSRQRQSGHWASQRTHLVSPSAVQPAATS